MNGTFRLVRDDLTPSLRQIQAALTGEGKRRVLRGMAKEFWNIARGNFGVNKANRPTPWPPLAPSYIKKLKAKSFGTPLVPTLLRSGSLLNSIRMTADQHSATVWTDNPHAATHQFGDSSRNIPARPFFPVDSNGNLTQYADTMLFLAAATELNRAMER